MNGATRIVTDLNGRVVDASPSAGELLGVEGRGLPGKPLAAFVAPERRQDFRNLLLDLAHGDGPVGTSLCLQRRSGEQVDVEVEAVAEAEGGLLEWLLAVPGVDAEPPPVAAPVPTGFPVRRLLARLPVGVISVNEQLIVDYLNPAAHVFVQGARVGEMLPDPLPSFSLRTFVRRLFGPDPPLRQVVETASGRLLELDGIPGEDESALLLVQDVTARERRRRAEHEFASNAAHELRTPIAAITSALDVLNAGAKEVPEDRELFLGHIERETGRLARLVAALLLLARIQTGQQRPSLALVEVGPLLAELAAELEPSNGVAVRVDCKPGVAMLADADLLRQAVWNLALNAASHTRAGEIRLTGRDLGAMAEIEVRDTGSGMNASERARVFDRFFRTERRPGGFGLGLPIAQGIVSALGGTLILDSEPNVGTRARVHVPSARVVA